MLRIISALILFSMIVVALCGCGGGGSKNVAAPFVNIEPTRVVPKVVNISSGTMSRAGEGVQWVNVDSAPHKIVSGTLDPQGSPLVAHTINITLTGFNPNASTADLGDTIRFNNLTGNSFTMNIVDDNGQVVSTVVFAIGELRTIVFPGAGRFTFRQQGSGLFLGSIILFGQPHPDNQFESPILTNGGTFTRQFNAPGTFPYFIEDLNNPNNSFITGTINVN